MCQLAATNVIAVASAMTANAIKIFAFALTLYLLANRYPECVLSYLVSSAPAPLDVFPDFEAVDA